MKTDAREDERCTVFARPGAVDGEIQLLPVAFPAYGQLADEVIVIAQPFARGDLVDVAALFDDGSRQTRRQGARQGNIDTAFYLHTVIRAVENA